MSPHDLRRILQGRWPRARVALADRRYSALPLEALPGRWPALDESMGWKAPRSIASAFTIAREALRLRDYLPESGDCDDFAQLWHASARAWHRIHRNRSSAPACGVVHGYTERAGRGHAMCWALMEDGTIRMVEPQPGPDGLPVVYDARQPSPLRADAWEVRG